MEQAREAKLQIQKHGQPGITMLRFTGVIDESFEGARLSQGLEGQLVIALADVRRITSFGIRNWIDFISRASQSCSEIYFVECSPRIIDQFNMVAGFGGKGLILSFFAPFRCENCDGESTTLIQVGEAEAMIREMRLEGGRCSKDQGGLFLDDDPQSFLSYIAAQPSVQVDPKVASFLAERTQYVISDSMRKVRVEKRFRDRFTFISVAGDLGEDLPIAKIADGLEGDVVLDLGGVSRITEQGLASWRVLLQAIAPVTERMLVIGLPPSMLENLERGMDLAEKGQVLSLFLPYHCKICSITSNLEIEVHAHQKELHANQAPELKCPDCGNTAQCVAPEGITAKLSELPVPSTEFKAQKLIRWAREAVATPAAAAPATVAAQPHAGAPWRPAPGIWIVTAMMLVVVGLAAFWALRSRPGGGGKADEGLGKITFIEASHPKPPAWQNQTFAVEGSQILVTGTSGLVPDKEDGFKQAKAAALEELSQQVAISVRDPEWVEHIGSQFQNYRTKLLGDMEKALISGDQDQITRARKRVFDRREMVAQALLEGASSIIHPERIQYYWEKVSTGLGVRYNVWALFRAGKLEFKRLVEYFTQREEALSAQGVGFFPSLAWRYDLTQGAVILGLNPDSPLRYLGILHGDIILSSQDRTIKDARGFRRVLAEEQAELKRTGGTMLLKIKRGDSPVIDHRMVVARGGESPVPVKRGGGVRVQPPTKNTKKLPPANIWDDNPYD